MTQVELAERLPSCSRCGGPLITSAVMPQEDADGFPIHLELCSSCDTEKPAAGALLRWFATGGGHDMSRVQEGADLLMDWTKEGMAEHGWCWSAYQADEATGEPDRPAPHETNLQVLMTQDIPGNIADVERLQEIRDTLRAQLATATAEERARLQEVIRHFGEATAEGLAAQDPTAAELRDEVPQRPDPLSPEAERGLTDLFRHLTEEPPRPDTDG
ncbi:hypothetical protein FBY35_4109 [Streptomyces sp. SLBN-118]|uniref:DUF6300 family protein n=1 Tax=Streptomyces sp. SLBN-118 TaxID=2768454 RepID=UPI00116F674D|nr:DUF6300 family protein [Streptomyces sp. SLBN-118]TQK42681.1 hypothetical protein FBY35_4109 [Streptomyces sp. SLBN-118]